MNTSYLSMSFAAFALGEGAGAGAGPGDGGGGDGPADRLEELQDAWDVSMRPLFTVQGPNVLNFKYGIFSRYFTYRFNPVYAWPAKFLVEHIQALYRQNPHPNAVMVQVLAETLEEAPAGAPPFPSVFDDQTPLALRNAMREMGRRGAFRIWSTPLVPPSQIGWAALQALLEREDAYDAAEDVVGLYGNRLSRLRVTVKEFTVPKGHGLADAKIALGLTDRAMVNIEAALPLCGQACLAYALADAKGREHIRRRPAFASAKAAEVGAAIGAPGAMSLHDFDSFAARFGWRVVILENKESVLYTASPPAIAANTAYLLLHASHYYFIADIDLFSRPSPFSRSAWCHACLTPLPPSRMRSHACLASCGACGASFADLASRAAHLLPPSAPACPRCASPFRGAGCEARHRCRAWVCPACSSSLPLSRAGGGHVCGELYCGPCDAFYSPADGHRCFLLPLTRQKNKTPDFWAFDLECARGPCGEQVVTVAVFKRLYGDRELVVCRGEDALWAFLEGRADRGVFLSHNGAKYDTFLVFHLLLLRSPSPPRATFAGLKLLRLEWRGATFLDSFRHLGMGLDACARSFGLPVSKGFFPYDFYTVENAAYAGAPPAPSFFTPAARADPAFPAWHAGFALDWLLGAGAYDVAEEVVKYCVRDVDILAAVLEAYRDAGLAATGVDPLSKTTIASFAMAAFRARYLPERAIASLLPDEDAFARAALKGGRTDARQVLRAWSPAEVAAGAFGRYADVNSLYPWVLRNCLLPVGAPSWAPAGALADAEAFVRGLGPAALALVECDVACPAGLHHPVLVATDPDGRLRATLHAKSGVFTSVELALALDKGYRLSGARRALCFEGSTGLFAPYIDFYFALKREAGAAGDKAAYALAKIMMNSLWGKFAQRPSAEETVAYKNPLRWFQDLGLAAAGRISLSLKVEGPSYLVAGRAAEKARPLATTNSALAAFVTAQARVRLYGALDALGERVIYHDTDSVIYAAEPAGAEPLVYGPELGAWKDECGGVPIVRVCCLGPKTYAFRTADGAEVVKSKGFSASFTLAEYEDAALAFFAGAPARLSQPELRFVRTLGSGIAVLPGVKTMLPLMDKLDVVSPSLTRPRGFSDGSLPPS